MAEVSAYPLHWPQGWPRSDGFEASRFRVTPDRARRYLLKEISRLVGWSYSRDMVVISSNVRLRLDGEPYSSQRPPEDVGVAVYFRYGDRPMVFACDRWSAVHDNIHAIAKTIESLRGIERWGASDMLERAFTGFLSLEHKQDHWRKILGVPPSVNTIDEVKMYWKKVRAKTFPREAGADDKAFKEAAGAWEQAQNELAG